MRLAIADPPYLGRARRYYHEKGGGRAYGQGVADHHDDADEWDRPERHEQLVRQLEFGYDGWAIATAANRLAVYTLACPEARIAVWHRENAQPSGSRIRNVWEAVVLWVPESRRGRNSADGFLTPDVLRAGVEMKRAKFAGAKPMKWTRWVLDMLGYEPEDDTVDDLFPGSGNVQHAIAQGVLL
jgi:hypothetical protein